MYEAIITELDTSAGTAKVKFANYNTIETVLISQLGEFTGKKTERGRYEIFLRSLINFELLKFLVKNNFPNLIFLKLKI